VSEMIENGLIPNIEHSVAIDYGFEPVRAECAEGDREKAKCRGNSSKCDHFSLLFTEAFHFSVSLNFILRLHSA